MKGRRREKGGRKEGERREGEREGKWKEEGEEGTEGERERIKRERGRESGRKKEGGEKGRGVKRDEGEGRRVEGRYDREPHTASPLQQRPQKPNNILRLSPLNDIMRRRNEL